MRMLPAVAFVSVIAFGLAWSGCLVLVGLHALSRGPAGTPARDVLLCLGIAAIAAGNFVFMEVVADRIVRPARHWPIDAVQTLTALSMLGGLGAALSIWLGATA
ncbi:MAG: hypothetical protein SFZ24_11220 [Planctomycetota bacterium]|nr:hypothetical protein [Planctomycetota bacterium]